LRALLYWLVVRQWGALEEILKAPEIVFSVRQTKAKKGYKMKKVAGLLVILAWIALFARPVFPAPQELAGKIIRVDPEKKEIVLKLSDEERKAREIKVRLQENASLEGVTDLTQLKQGTPVIVEADRGFFARFWVATRLEVGEKRGLNSVEKEKLDDLEQKSSENKITPMEFETNRISLKPGDKIEF
jgi:hypothetical protein